MPTTRTSRSKPIKTGKSSRKKQTPPRIPFLPDALQAFIARRFLDGFALFFCLGGAFTLLALLSYNQTDPSINTAGDTNAITNWMGPSGASASDILIQSLGGASFFIGAIVTLWGIRLFNRQTIRPFALRLIALMLGTLAAAVAFAQIPSGDFTPQPYLGGTVGTLTLNKIGAIFGYKSMSIFGGIIAILTLTFASCMTKAELAKIGQFILNTIKSAALFIVGTATWIYGWITHYNDDAYRPARPSPLANLKEKLDRPKKRPPEITGDTPKKSSWSLQSQAKRMNDAEEAAPTPLPAAKASPSIPVVAKPEAASAKKPIPQNTQQHFTLEDGEEWEFPALDILDAVPESRAASQLDENALRRNAELLQNVLADFNVEGEITSIHPGPVVTLYELEPAPGTKSAKVIGLADDIARSMSAVSVRVAVVPGRNVIGIELPNKTRQIVYMRELIQSKIFEQRKAKLPLILGKDIGGQPILADLAKMPHLLVAGTTGSGKSVAVNTMILSILYSLSPEQCRFIMIDPKMLELSVYDDIPHLLSPVVTEPGKAVVALKWTVNEMEDRYRAMSKLGVRNIEGYNDRIREALKKGETIMKKVQTGFDPDTGNPTFEDREMELKEIPYIVVVVDEFADLMLVAGKDVESAIQRLAQMARAAGIHLIMATQRPSVDVITGVIKANFPTRISFQVTSKVDSRTILGEGGAEQLLGMGDMLYMAPGGRITRVHGPFVSDENVEHVVADLKSKAAPAYVDSVTDEDGLSGGSEVMDAMFSGGNTGGTGGGSDVDEFYDEAVAIVAREGRASTSFIQRCLQIGYNRAARIIEEMEKQGVVSKANATGKREVLVSDYSDVG
ncbi:MAG: DNA translocase FtsK [Alphaproteobacteria bacterium]